MISSKFLVLIVLAWFHQVSCRSILEENDVRSTIDGVNPLLSVTLRNLSSYFTSINDDLHSIKILDTWVDDGKRTRQSQDTKVILDRIMDKIDSLMKEAAVKVDDLHDKMNCIHKRLTAAREEATEGVIKVGRCIVEATSAANVAIQPIITKLENEIMKLGPLAKKIAVTILDCRTAQSHISCIKDALNDGEKELSSISYEVGENLKAAGNTWNSFIEDLQICFHDGTEEVLFIKGLRLEILECLE